jgi:hypothetical protein
MKSIVRFAFAMVLALSVSAGLAFAQQPTGRQNNRQQQRVGALVQSALDSIAAQSDPLQLIFRKDVQHDLAMDLGQRNKLDNLHDRQQGDLQQVRMMNRRNPTPVTELQAKQSKETQGKIDELLTAVQNDRLKQIALQLQGNAAILTPDLQKQLGMTNEQIQQAKAAKQLRDSQLLQLQSDAAQGSIVGQDLVAQVQQLQSDMNGALGEVLTAEQADHLKTLLGKPFKAG